MQQTTYGVTPRKTRVLKRNIVDYFLDENQELFENLKNSQQCLYSNMKLVSDQALNYLNTFIGDPEKEQLRLLLKKEFIECEKIYPYLGDLFIHKYFANNRQKHEKNEKFIFQKDTSTDFADSLKIKEIKDIFRYIINEASLEYTVSVQKNLFKDIIIKKNNILNFDLDYDASFLGGKDFHTMQSYRFVIIDGYIESVGEIHHLLDLANKTKEPHVIFCFGMSEEVSHVIKHNNTNNKFEVMPVLITFDENTINVLSDIAVLHKSTIVSSQSGETISQAVRRELPVGREIIFHRKGFKINPVASEADLMLHRLFLNNKINEVTRHIESKKLLTNRLKRFSSKTIKIYIPEDLYNNNDFLRMLDYVLRFMTNSNKRFVINKLNNFSYYLPEELIDFVDKKVNSIKEIYSKIDRLIVYERN